MGLLAIFLVVLTDIFVAILDTRTKSSATSHIEQDGRYILARLNFALHSQMNLIQSPANIGDTSDTLTYAFSFIPFTYEINGNNLQYRVPNIFQPSEPDIVNSLNSSETTISNLSFQKIGNAGGKDTIKVNFTVSSGQESKSFSTTVGRR